MCNSFTYFIVILLISAASEACDKCISKDKCIQFGQLSKQEQDSWIQKHSCEPPDDDYVRSKYFGFDPIAKGDYICCSESLWPKSTESTTQKVESRLGFYDNNFGNRNNYDGQINPSNFDYNYPNSRNFGNNGQNMNDWGNDGYPGNGYLNNGNNNGYDPNQGNPNYNNNFNPGLNSQNPPQNQYSQNNNPYVTHDNNFNRGGQCPLTSFPPKPDTGCCGREASDSDRITGQKKKPRNNVATNQPRYNGNTNQVRGDSNYFGNPWNRYPNYGMGPNRVARSTDKVNIEIENRITGGHETDFTQFPWTALLKTTFDYGDKRAAFNCGGSLISSKYVLTAGHCVYDASGKMIGAEINLAEYDKRTFPKDCKFVLGQGQKCVENIVMNAEDVILHPQYDDDRLLNDIAMLRLRGNAPYTEYIRPICLPSIDIDSPDMVNIRLAVAGWGRNGHYRSDIKQSTIVNLVPQEKCKKYYPTLTRRSMCAAGYTGEDTCKGDSGGPLMTVYGGKYQVVGIVSGKRADSPCGTAVPSLYTNVYHYLDWIQSNMKN